MDSVGTVGLKHFSQSVPSPRRNVQLILVNCFPRAHSGRHGMQAGHAHPGQGISLHPEHEILFVSLAKGLQKS